MANGSSWLLRNLFFFFLILLQEASLNQNLASFLLVFILGLRL